MKTVVISQFAGAGDIIMCQSIANDFRHEGYRVIWPVDTVYAPLAKHFPQIMMVDKGLINIDYNSNKFHSEHGCEVIPLRFSDSICKVTYNDCMKSKFLIFNKDWTKWKDNFRCVRDTKSERRLYFDILKLSEGEQYNLISTQFTTAGKRSSPINVNNGLRNVTMSFIEGYTLIDWLYVMQKAANIHAVASSNIYLFELYEMEAKEIHLYPRLPIEVDHRNYDYLLTKNYILH